MRKLDSSPVAQSKSGGKIHERFRGEYHKYSISTNVKRKNKMLVSHLETPKLKKTVVKSSRIQNWLGVIDKPIMEGKEVGKANRNTAKICFVQKQILYQG